MKSGRMVGMGVHGVGGWWAPLVVGLLLRIVWASWVPVVPISDSGMYWAFAQQIAGGVGYAYPDGHLTAYWPVGTSAVAALLMLLIGPDVHAITVTMNLVCSAFILLGVHRLALVWSSRPKVAAAAVWVTALWPMQIMMTTVLCSELLFNALLVWALVFWGRGARRPWLCAGLFTVFMVGATYVRPTALPLLLTIPGMACLVGGLWRRNLLQAALVAVLAVLLFLPWALRNQAVVGAPAPVSTNFGPNFWMGNNPETNGGYMPLKPMTFANEAERDRHYKALALAYIRESSWQVNALNLLKRARLTFDRESIAVHWNSEGLAQLGASKWLGPFKLFSSAYWWLVLAVGGLGLMHWLRHHARCLVSAPIWHTVGLFTVVPLLTVGQDRYHVPLAPFLALGAAWLLCGRGQVAPGLEPPRAAS